MALFLKQCGVGLMVLLIGSYAVDVVAESLFVPRLGYPAQSSKRIYLDVMHKDRLKAEKETAKEAKKREKEERKAQEKADKARRKELKEQAKQAEKEAKEAEKRAKEEAKKAEKAHLAGLDKDDKKTYKDDKKLSSRKKRQAAKQARLKVRLAEKQAKEKNRLVSGDYYLYDLKKERVIYKESPKVQTAEGVAPAPYYVEFRELPREGLFDLTIKGSGHRSEAPIRVSDTIYWDALQPVMQDIARAHCPQLGETFKALQQCVLLKARPQNPSIYEGDQPITVQGGWYTSTDVDSGLIKESTKVSTLTQLMLTIYNVNPESFKYFKLRGPIYSQSDYPDILDEVNWGIRFLLTTQRPSGGFSKGVTVKTVGMREHYTLLPEDPEATARSIATLALGMKAFGKEDLSYTIKMVRAAERGWQYLEKQSSLDPEWVLMASGALMEVTQKPKYKAVFEKAKARTSHVSRETAFALGELVADKPVYEGNLGPLAVSRFEDVMPQLLQLKASFSREPQQRLAHYMNDLFGYEQLTFVSDTALKEYPAWDPIGWSAQRAGNVINRVNYKLDERNINRVDPDLDPEFIQALETKELQARARIIKGYNAMELTLGEKAYLAYTLALLNQYVGEEQTEEERKQAEKEAEKRAKEAKRAAKEAEKEAKREAKESS